MISDPIADMLTRLRNAAMAGLDRTKMPLSKLKKNLAEILKQEGYINDYSVDEAHPATLTVFLRYTDKKPAFNTIRRTSRPGRRVYVGHDEIAHVKDGLGVAILSTSNGLLTDRDARSQKIGGELLCEVW
jgi:small subunit ribosomal protein S8